MKPENINRVINDIVKECYWDYNIDATEIERILNAGDEREKRKLFSKIIINSNDKLAALMLFERNLLHRFFSDFNITYNNNNIERHVLVLRNLLLGERNYIKGLEWENK